MPFFTKKPVKIEARQVTLNQLIDVADWCHGAANFDSTITIFTLEGDMTAQLNDWVIRGVKDEFYPCKPDIFSATYDAVNDDDSEQSTLRQQLANNKAWLSLWLGVKNV